MPSREITSARVRPYLSEQWMSSMISSATCFTRLLKAWPFSGVVDADEADTFGVHILQEFDGVVVVETDGGGGEVDGR